MTVGIQFSSKDIYFVLETTTNPEEVLQGLEIEITNTVLYNKLLEIQSTLSLMTLRLNTLEKNEKLENGEEKIKSHLPLNQIQDFLQFEKKIAEDEEASKQLVSSLFGNF